MRINQNKSKFSLDTPESFRRTPDQYSEPLREERWLERANIAFRQGMPHFHIPRSDVFYIKALIKERFGYDLPVLYVEQLLIEEKMLTKGGNPIKVPEPAISEEALDKTQETENPPF